MIVSGFPSHFSLPPSILPYPTIPLPIIVIPLYPSPPPPTMLHASLLSLGYPERGDTTIALKVAVPDSDPPSDTSP